MVLANFQIENKLRRARFFQETFLLANTSVEVILEMPFLALSNADIQFLKKKLTWRSYTIAEALPTTKRVELINKKEFVKAALDEELNTFVVHVEALEAPLAEMAIHPSRETQIAALKQDKAPIKVSAKYSDFSDFFSEKKALVLPELTKLNQHAIDLQDSKQPLYEPI